MRSQCWSTAGVATLGLLAAGVSAQNGSTDSLFKLLDDKNLTSFASYIKQYPDILTDISSAGGVTLLAPDNTAFDHIPFGALNKVFDQNDTLAIDNAFRYHVLNGTHRAVDLVPGISYNFPTLMDSSNYTNVTGGQRVTNIKQAGNVIVYVSGLGTRSEIVEGDLEFEGGIVQVVTSPIIPPIGISATALAYNLTSFNGALYTTSKVDYLSNLKDITIFAPSNPAFIALGRAVEEMTVQQLSTVLEFHILYGRVLYSSDIKNGTSFRTSNNRSIEVQQLGNNIYLNSAQLITKDVLIANGVMHVLDNVLNPESDGPPPDPTIATQPPVFPNASSVTFIPFTGALPCTTDCPALSTPVTDDGATATSAYSFRTSSSKAVAAAIIARETGIAAVGMLAAVGGAMLMI